MGKLIKMIGEVVAAATLLSIVVAQSHQIAPWKEELLLSKGVDIDRLNRKHTYISSQANKLRATHAATAGMDLTKWKPKASHLAAQDIDLDDLTELCRRTNADGTVDDRCYLLDCPAGSPNCEPQ